MCACVRARRGLGCNRGGKDPAAGAGDEGPGARKLRGCAAGLSPSPGPLGPSPPRGRILIPGPVPGAPRSAETLAEFGASPRALGRP